MRITIKYEASWRNSFLDGSNNEPLPKGGRTFVGSMTTLGKRDNNGSYPNFIKRVISHDTVMGILNRLIGDQRKLYQSRKCPNYFFLDIEEHISFDDQQNAGNPINTEMVYIRNMEGNTDQNSFTGMIKANDPAFTSAYASEFWGVLTLGIESLCQFICDESYQVNSIEQFDPIAVLEILDELNKLKAIDLELVKKSFTTLQSAFPDVAYKVIDEKIKPIELYCSALYLQIRRLGKKHDVSLALTKSGGIAGISKRGFTPKDFMDRYTTGNKKPIWGNPYQLKEKRKGEGEVVSLLTKANGTLDINLDIPEDKAQQLKDMIEAAGVSSFYLGKKGLAYVDVIR
ncbi:type I-Fv CRISPR-associated protein Cas5fv [Methylomonas sp. UP202]|uniref:type I-Fv CRISPR-associated protein Cas5fv n=1 Tax=Methylomonas sp. UP202 TaxID=3040943 RepID=UPI0024793309|nr:type I-Fv CRISPR-associated protein Cas5fv [Methylomonas sp. UP202]WGS84707.1 type I-Fv CRISPR-associated protein Cas5fv [Methylomonas sp. UP202]